MSGQFRIGIIGASGYAGGELVRLADQHPDLTVEVLGAHSAAGKSLGEVHPHLGGPERTLVSSNAALDASVDLMFLALPHGASAGPAMQLLERGVRVADLGADFRMHDPDRYAAAYGNPHAFPSELGRWPYGLPEVNRDTIAGSDRVAVPGCYPTSVTLAMTPLVAAGLIDPKGIVADAMSGVSGAGRGAKPHLTFGAVDQGVTAYAVAAHRHRPEMEQAIAAGAGLGPHEVVVSFTPHLVPMQRGILSTCSAPWSGELTTAEVLATLEKAYAAEPFIRVVDDPPQSRWVVGSNICLLSARVDAHAGRVIVVAVIDNLMKGAAGQAVQCANLMLGLPEEAGLPTAGFMP